MGHPELHRRALTDVGSTDAWAKTAQLPQRNPDVVDEGTSPPGAPALTPTRPLAAMPSLDALPSSEPLDDGERASEDEALEPPAPARARPVAVTAPLPQQPDLPQPDLPQLTHEVAAADLAEAKSSVPPRLRALDVVLLVCTLGLYGVVLWLKRRKPLAA
jgi:hypothetical protein